MSTLQKLSDLFQVGDQTPIDITVGTCVYPKMVLVRGRYLIKRDVDGVPAAHFVARAKGEIGKDGKEKSFGLGPFLFIYPAKGVNPNQPAYLGMPVAGISF